MTQMFQSEPIHKPPSDSFPFSIPAVRSSSVCLVPRHVSCESPEATCSTHWIHEMGLFISFQITPRLSATTPPTCGNLIKEADAFTWMLRRGREGRHVGERKEGKDEENLLFFYPKQSLHEHETKTNQTRAINNDVFHHLKKRKRLEREEVRGGEKSRQTQRWWRKHVSVARLGNRGVDLGRSLRHVFSSSSEQFVCPPRRHRHSSHRPHFSFFFPFHLLL